MNTKRFITELLEGTKQIHFEEVNNKPYLQLSVYCILTEVSDCGYESYDDILEIKGLDNPVMGKWVKAVIQKEDFPDTLKPILEDEDDFHSFELKGFISLMNGEITLEKCYLQQNY